MWIELLLIYKGCPYKSEKALLTLAISPIICVPELENKLAKSTEEKTHVWILYESFCVYFSWWFWFSQYGKKYKAVCGGVVEGIVARHGTRRDTRKSNEWSQSNQTTHVQQHNYYCY